MHAVLTNLNKEQKKAVNRTDGVVVVMAGPGTGKTQLLSARAANILSKKNVNSENILVLTYTNAAAKQAKERLADLIGYKGFGIAADTFHSFANSILLDSEESAEYIKERIQLTETERARAIEYLLDTTQGIKNIRPFGRPYHYAGAITKKISELKNEGVTPKEFKKAVDTKGHDLSDEKDLQKLKELALIYERYEEIKKGTDSKIFDERGRYDFDDMVIVAYEVLSRQKQLKKQYLEKYKYIMVDEFQDTNLAQLRLLMELTDKKNPNLFCVGDDDQSIYRFQGASRANFEILKKKFPGLEIIHLTENYRSTDGIIGLSGKIINAIPDKERLDSIKKLNSNYNPKSKELDVYSFTTEEEEILFIVDKIKAFKDQIQKSKGFSESEKNAPYNNIAVLLRKRKDIDRIIDAFLRAGIPYTTDGKENISREKRVRQLIDVINMASPNTDHEEKDLLLYRILTSDYMKIDYGDVLKFINLVKKSRYKKSQKNIYPKKTLLNEFIVKFPTSLNEKPGAADTLKLDVVKKIDFENPEKLHMASWALNRLLKDADARPVHDLLLEYINDVDFFKFILSAYDKKQILKVRDIRATASFINMIKTMSISNPLLNVTSFTNDLVLRQRHEMAIAGELMSLSQDGVRIITAHSSKGTEFHTVFIPFCIQDKHWPLKMRSELISIPHTILKTREAARTPEDKKRFQLYDETRLFYVASTRARTNLIFTSAVNENSVQSSFMYMLGIKPKEPEAKEEEIIKKFFADRKRLDPVKYSKDILKGMVADVVLTPTKVNNYLRCKRKFFYNSILLLPGRKRQGLVFGNCVHKALEECYRHLMKRRVFPEFKFFKEEFHTELGYQAVSESIRKGCFEKLPFIEEWYRKAKKECVIPLDLEKSKKIVLKGGINFSGKFDKIELEDKDKKTIRVIDYKTGNPDEHIKSLHKTLTVKDEGADDYLRQVVAYKILYENDIYEKTGLIVSHGKLVFLEPVRKPVKKYNMSKGEYISKSIPITDQMVRDYEEIVQNTWNRINRLDFEKQPDKDTKICKSCDFYAICWQ